MFLPHFKQSIYRKGGQLGLKKKYDTAFTVKIRYLAALAFVFESEVVQVFEDLLEYFEVVWIGRPGRSQSLEQFFLRKVFQLKDCSLWVNSICCCIVIETLMQHSGLISCFYSISGAKIVKSKKIKARGLNQEDLIEFTSANWVTKSILTGAQKG